MYTPSIGTAIGNSKNRLIAILDTIEMTLKHIYIRQTLFDKILNLI